MIHPLHEFRKGNDVLYTLDDNEGVSAGYTSHGILGYVAAP
jgi:hypothetical protein